MEAASLSPGRQLHQDHTSQNLEKYFSTHFSNDGHWVQHPKSNCYSFQAKSGMIIHVSSSQCLLKRKALFIPFPAVQLGCQWCLHPLIRHQRFLRSGGIAWQVHQTPQTSHPPWRDFATLLPLMLTAWWATLENVRKLFTGNIGNPIWSQCAETHAAATVSSPSVFPSLSPKTVQ